MTKEQARREIDSLDYYLQNHTDDYGEESHTAMMMAKDALSSSEKPNKWIPLKTRPMTDEESTFYKDWAEYGAELFDCPLPDDGQEVLVSWGGNVCIDTFVKDDSDGCYFEGVEIDDVEAWMPLPEPYKASPTGAESEE